MRRSGQACSCTWVAAASTPIPNRKTTRLTTTSVVLRNGVDPGFLALFRRDRCRCGGQRVVPAAGLGEGDDVADRVHPRQQRTDAVPAEGDAAVRRRTE